MARRGGAGPVARSEGRRTVAAPAGPVPADAATQAAPMLERVRAALPVLPPAEARVAQLLLDEPSNFVRAPVGDIAQRAGVSKPTVVRFCRSVGYEGLADFKLRLAGSLHDGVPFVHRAVGERDGVAEMSVKVLDNAISALLQLRATLDERAIARAVQALAQACLEQRRIDFYGVGNSGYVALDAQHKFFRLGVHANALNDGHVQIMSATMLAPGDCAVLISNAGRSRDLLDVADLAIRKGATTIALTASGSPLARQLVQAGHVLLAADHPEDHERYSPMVSRMLHLALVDVLTTGVALRIGAARLQPMLREIKQNLQTSRYAHDR